ncbi:MAG: DNA phosphorothioation-associated putative methyltransferase [Microcystis sp. LE19-131.1A]|uniref:DNA phosphorothioation-associated putative methyltransferase n=1 Tax=Microcystis sp. LE19-131.1A TaxID=3016439 RepID=UPI0022BCA23F|nr:DNA phosphorothioation-associated putative methyltransferase [Microcystis sp. LE19-131.1A]MCZ8242960.1 DNA phosphorothioation-associated putative methyltransferase [Microcystis sp. LE19-131.1A]
MAENFALIVQLCQVSPIGKLLPGALYVHREALHQLDPILQSYEQQARINQHLSEATIIKFSTDKPKISYLFYPDFDREPHPVLTKSLVVDLGTLILSEWNYQNADNPPILHRKETFVTRDYPFYEQFEHLTKIESALGLLNSSYPIGTKQEWQRLLRKHHLDFAGDYLVCNLEGQKEKSIIIDRHKAALVRKTLSRPARLALAAGLFLPETTFFDYGCGYGGDIERIAEQGYQSEGWDPYYRPDSPLIESDIVNLGYVINVIESAEERQEALLKAWQLTRQVLIVSAQILIDDSERGLMVYEDGIITRRNTFQKYYQQEELKQYIDSTLGVDSIPITLGIYLVFREEEKAETFRLSRCRSRATTPKIKTHLKRFEDYEDLLTPLMEFYTQQGRLPVAGELLQEEEIKAEFGTFRRAFQVILQVTEGEEWEIIADKRRADLLLYLALSQFSHCPKVRELSPATRADFKALFGSYRNACALAEEVLISAGNLPAIARACENSSLGKLSRYSLTIHISILEKLPMLLRLYEGCASQTIGRLENANVVRLSFRQPKISYLYYPNFDTEIHPILATSMDVYLGSADFSFRDYRDSPNPPILHEKELLVTADYPNYDKLVRLTQLEKDWGLLEDRKAIERLQGWQKCLEEHCATIKGHQILWRKDADPYKVRILRAKINARRNQNKSS